MLVPMADPFAAEPVDNQEGDLSCLIILLCLNGLRDEEVAGLLANIRGNPT
jgi:hypothetical protein